MSIPALNRFHPHTLPTALFMPNIVDREAEPEDLLPRIRKAIFRHRSVCAGDTVVVAVSGGADSVSLLDLLARLRLDLQLDLHVAHLNHGLRGVDADEDASFVGSLADGLGFAFHLDRTDTAAAAKQGRLSLEEAARVARLRFLEQVRVDTGAQRVALGHTRSDQAETVLMRLLRGAGAKGLGAMRPVRDGVWIRPMLDIPRSDVILYAGWRGLDFRDDDSNTDPRFLRNRIRHDLLPHLEHDFASGLEQVLARTADILRQDDELLDSLTASNLQKSLIYSGKRKIILDGITLFRYHIAIQRRLFRNVLQQLDVSGNGLSFSSICRLCELSSSRRKSVQIGPDVRATKCGAYLILSRATPRFCVPVTVPGLTKIPQIDQKVITHLRPTAEVLDGLRSGGPFRACFDRAALDGELVVRSRRDGDRIRPFGMEGSGKVSELLIDAKVPQALRDEVPVVACDGQVLWVAGVRRSAVGSVRRDTPEVVEIEFKGEGCRLNGIRS